MFKNGITTFTSESVCAGHPDKICDAISDAILDTVLSQDRYGHVGCETMAGFNRVVLSGEIKAKAKLDFRRIAKEQIRRLGYTDPSFNFSDQSPIDVYIHEQSPEIAVGVDHKGAGDQGCLRKGTLVRTKKGFIPIENVRIGDYVATPYGWKKVLKSMKTGVKPVIDIVLTNGMLLTCTKDHKVLCFDKSNSTYWKAAADLQKGEFICTLKPQQSFSDKFWESYVKDNSSKPQNSRGIFLMPHPWKDELIDETRIGLELPYSIGIFKGMINQNETAEVYDLEIEDAHMFSGNGIYVHNSMFGYACRETKELMPTAIMIAHALTKRMDQAREEKLVPYLRPDGKSQVTVEYEDGKPTKIVQVVIAIPHKESVKLKEVKKDIYDVVVIPVLDQFGFKIGIKDLIVNGTGVWHHGGPASDCGVTGRKIVVDGYGGYARVGGGAFCLAGDSLVSTEKGLIRIDCCQEVAKKGLLVKTDIHPMSAAVWYDNGIKPTELITTKDGYQLEATLNHSIRIIDSNGNYVWKDIESLKEGDWISIQTKNRLFGNDEIPKFNFKYKEGTAEGRKKKYNFPSNLIEDYAYLLGLLVGDGDCTDAGCIRVCVCEKDMQIIVQSLFERLVGDKGKIYGHWAYLGGVELRAFLEHLGLTDARSFEKVVPNSIFSASERNCAAFLRGLFDTDGSIRFDGRYKNTKRIHLATTSKKLAEQVQLLLLNFGIISKIYVVQVPDKKGFIKERKINSQHTLYNVVLKGSRSNDIFIQKIGFGLFRKNEILAKSTPPKRNLRIIPNQRERIRRLFKKLPLEEQRKERDKIGRFIRSSEGKATKELTYEKLKEFIHLYDNLLKKDEDYVTLKELYYMEHYYSRLQKKIPSFAHTYDLNIPFSHTFTANGIVCHNSGKDPTKVDRSGAYAARFLAKNIVAQKLADKAEVRLAYFIGARKPSMQDVETFGTNKKSHKVILSFMEKILDTSVSGILKELDLQRPIYLPTASYGHFGRSEFPWEKIV